MENIDWLKRTGWGPEQLEDLRNIGYAYIRQGKYEIALPLFEALHFLDPDSAYDAQTLGALYLQVNNPAKSLKIFDRALKLDSEHSVTLLNVTKALFLLGRKEEGLRLANILKNERNPQVSSIARAFLLAYG